MAGMIVVTGGAGFIGANLVAELNARGRKDVLVVDELPLNETKAGYLKDFEVLDVLDKATFRDLVTSGTLPPTEAIYHLGACSSTTETDEAFLQDNNVGYTRDLCTWCLEHGARFVYASSAATYGDGSLGYSDADAVTPTLKPLNLYGQSKQDFDVWALEQGLLDRIVGLKYFNVYGPREDHKGDMRSVVHKSYGQIRETGKVKLFKSHKSDFGDGEQLRDFVYVKDAVAVTLFFGEENTPSGVYNCGTGQARSWVDLANGVFKALNQDSVIEFIEMPEAIRDKYQYFTQAEAGKLRAAGFDRPFYSLEDGIKDYVECWLSRHD